MAARRTTLRIALFLVLFAEPMAGLGYAADYIRPTSSSAYGRSHVGMGVEECSNLLITDDSGRRVVRLCRPPLNMDPRGNFVPGSSGGSNVTLSRDVTISN